MMRIVSTALIGAGIFLAGGTTTLSAQQTRSGFWFSLGWGYATLGCNECVQREDGVATNLSAGGTLSRHVLLGVGLSGWAKRVEGTTLTVGTLDARVRFYPKATGGLFLTGGAGLGEISAKATGSDTRGRTGLGVVLGLGVDLRIGSNVSLTPFWNGLAVAMSDVDPNVGQIGVGITVH